MGKIAKLTQHADSANAIDHERIEPVPKRANGDPAALDQKLLNCIESETSVEHGAVI